MGRALIIICAGLLVSLGYTFFGISSQSQSLTQRNINTYNKTKAVNTAHSGIQLAIQRYNNDPTKEEFNNVTENYEEASLTLSLDEIPNTTNPDKIRVTSSSVFNGADHTVISTYNVSVKQPLIPEYKGALSILSGKVNLTKDNGKVHFNGNDNSSDASCGNKPGITVWNPTMEDDFNDKLDTIAGEPEKVSYDDNSTKFEDITDLIEAFAPNATTLDNDFDWESSTAQNPGVYFVEGQAHFSGKDEGYGILIIRNNSTVNITDFSVSGKFKFNGLVIFENQSNFSGTGQAEFNGTVLAGSNTGATFDLKANGKFNANYDCTAKKYADLATNKLLNTTIYKLLSIYE